eukprot:14329240-Alexandrium_andersonii.AAC.1
MNPCTERNAALTSEGTYWAGGSGSYGHISDEKVDDPSCEEGALAWLGVLWKLKQGCWYPSDRSEREACQE